MAEKSTGDSAVDANFKTMADNARAQITAANRRISVYTAKRNELQAEFDALGTT